MSELQAARARGARIRRALRTLQYADRDALRLLYAGATIEVHGHDAVIVRKDGEGFLLSSFTLDRIDTVELVTDGKLNDLGRDVCERIQAEARLWCDL